MRIKRCTSDATELGMPRSASLSSIVARSQSAGTRRMGIPPSRLGAPLVGAVALLTGVGIDATAAAGAGAADGTVAVASPAVCLSSGDGYLRAHLAGAVEAHIDWRNAGLDCQGEPRDMPVGVRLSFKRQPAQTPDLLFVFGISDVREGKAAREVGANLTVIVQGTDRIYGTLGDSRCTVDSLAQHRLGQGREYRVEARGFCTQPAHAVRGDGALLVSTFEFAGRVNYDVPKEEEPLAPLPGASPTQPSDAIPKHAAGARPPAHP